MREWDLLLSASQKNNVEQVQRLINDEGVPPSHGNVVGQTALHIAALWGNVETMQVLIHAGADVNAQNQIAKMTPLHCAIRGTFQTFRETHARRIECVKLLLQAGADGNLCDLKGMDALGTIDDAIRESQLRKMGNIDREMKEMREAFNAFGLKSSPLLQFIDTLELEELRGWLCPRTADGNEEVVSQIELNKGILASAEKFKSLVNENIEKVSVYQSLREIIHCLLEAGADPNSHPSATDSLRPLEGAPLHIICTSVCSGSPTVAKFAAEIVGDLHSHGATIGSVTMELLPIAAHRGKLDAVEFLIKKVGVDPNFRGRQGMTSLILSSRSGKADIVRLLLENESLELDVLDDAGKSAMDYATANGKEDIVRLLTK